MSCAPQSISSGRLSVHTAKGPIGRWSKPYYFAFVEDRIPLDRLELAYKHGLKKSCRCNPFKNGKPIVDEQHLKTIAVAAVSGSGILAAYESDDSKHLERPLFLIDLRDVIDVTLTPKMSKRGRFAMTIHTSGKPVRVAAASKEALAQWVRALNHRARRVAYGDFAADAENLRVYQSLANTRSFRNAVADAAAQAALLPASGSAEVGSEVTAAAETPNILVTRSQEADRSEEGTVVEQAAGAAPEDAPVAAEEAPVVRETPAAASTPEETPAAADNAVEEAVVEEAQAPAVAEKKLAKKITFPSFFAFTPYKRTAKATSKAVPQDIDDLAQAAPAPAPGEPVAAPLASPAAEHREEAPVPQDAAGESKQERTATELLRHLQTVLPRKPSGSPAASPVGEESTSVEASQAAEQAQEVPTEVPEATVQPVDAAPAVQEAAAEGRIAEAPVAEIQQPVVIELTLPTPAPTIIRQLSSLFRKKKTAIPGDVAEEGTTGTADSQEVSRPEETAAEAVAEVPAQEAAAEIVAETPAQESAAETPAAEPAKPAEAGDATVEAAKEADAQEDAGSNARAFGRLFRLKSVKSALAASKAA